MKIFSKVLLVASLCGVKGAFSNANDQIKTQLLHNEFIFTSDSSSPERSLEIITDESCFDVIKDKLDYESKWKDLFKISPASPNINPEKYFDYYGSCSFKDLSPYYDCDEARISCNYTTLLNEMRGACEIYGGTLYSITGSVTCEANQDNPNAVVYNNTHYPYCIPSGCDVNITGLDPFRSCISYQNLDYKAEKAPSPLSQECREEMNALESIGLGPLNISDIISDEDDSWTIINYENRHYQFLKPCEEAGGILYKYSDSLTFGGQTIKHLNHPICLGSSCDVETYFYEVIVPWQRYQWEGNGPEDEYYQQGDCDYSVVTTYDFLSYSEARPPPTSSPTRSPTPSPTPAPTTPSMPTPSTSSSGYKQHIIATSTFFSCTTFSVFCLLMW